MGTFNRWVALPWLCSIASVVCAQPASAPRVFQTALSDFYPEYRLVCRAIPNGSSQEATPLAKRLERWRLKVQPGQEIDGSELAINGRWAANRCPQREIGRQ